MREISDDVIIKTEGCEKGYQPPKRLPFESTGSYQTDREAYLKMRETLFHKNTVAWKKSTGKVLKAVKAGTTYDETEHNEIVQERRNLTALDRFFDIIEEC
jgi:hypothetical protein